MALDNMRKSAHSLTHSFFIHKYLSNFYFVMGPVQATSDINMKKVVPFHACLFSFLSDTTSAFSDDNYNCS